MSQANEEFTVELPGGVLLEMVWIDPGNFTMESPQYEVTISQGFYLLTEVGVEASALAVMPASHRGWRLIEHESYYDDPPMCALGEDGFRPFKRHRVPPEQVDPAREKLVATNPGDGLFFSNYTWHRSEPNRSGRTRAFYAIACQRRQ